MGMSKTTSKISRVFAATATAALLAGCSASADRFADYPSIATSSVAKKQTQAAGVDQVETSPLSGDRVASARPSWQNAPSPSAGYTPPAPTYSTQAPALGYAPAQNGQVTVQPGQTMYSLARANGLTVSQLAGANNIRAPYTLAVGQRLSVPGTSNPVSPRPTVAFANAPAPRAQVQSGSTDNDAHVVRPGETLYSLGRAYEMRPQKIAAYNGLSMNSGLSIGQRVRIPGAGNTSPVADAAPSRLPERDMASSEPDYLDRSDDGLRRHLISGRKPGLNRLTMAAVSAGLCVAGSSRNLGQSRTIPATRASTLQFLKEPVCALRKPGSWPMPATN